MACSLLRSERQGAERWALRRIIPGIRLAARTPSPRATAVLSMLIGDAGLDEYKGRQLGGRGVTPMSSATVKYLDLARPSR